MAGTSHPLLIRSKPVLLLKLLPILLLHPLRCPLMRMRTISGILSQRSTITNQRSGQLQRPVQKWKGTDKISRIYGYWIGENE
jgi:hypothetical protein